jgi:hypothetical protein
MLSLGLTIRLDGRSIHLVRDARDCDTCRNHAVHVHAEPGLFLRGEINRAAQGNASTLAEFRDLAERYGLLHDVHRVIDANVLEHVAWLLETRRLIAVECVPVQQSGPAAPAPEKRRAESPRTRPAPSQDVKTWVEIELLTDAGKPVANQRYRVTVPGGVVEEGNLDAKGRARINGIDPGTCDISFPDIDAREWKRA